MERVGFKRCMRQVIRRAYGLAALFGVPLFLAVGLHGGETHATSAGLPDTAYADAGGCRIRPSSHSDHAVGQAAHPAARMDAGSSY